MDIAPVSRLYDSGAQDKAAGLEAELEVLKKALSEARRQLAESRRDAKAGGSRSAVYRTLGLAALLSRRSLVLVL